MSNFLLSNVEEAHHKRCQDECEELEGVMLKCMNLKGAGNKPCSNIIHAKCAGYDPCVLPHFSSYYCTDCTTSSSELHQKMSEIEEKAKIAAKIEAEKSKKNEHEDLKKIAEKLADQLREKVEKLRQQAAEIEAQKVQCQRQESEIKQLQDTVSKMAAERSSAGSQRNLNSTFFDRLNETLRLAEGFEDSTIPQRSAPSNSQTNIHYSSINQSTYITSNTSTGWPNYEEQQRVADQYDDHRLMLLRASLAKPVSFDGDVTKWATFLSEFIRTSVRGSFRDFEDMDRLRDLIIGEAREMFVTELSDPCAEALSTLKRLDEFFGVRGNAVRVAMDRITQLPRVDKFTDKQKLTSLYTQVKQFALQCRIHNQQHELASQAILFIIESKMFNDHVKAWRQWTKANNKAEDVDGVIAYLEEQIRDLSFKNNRSKTVVTTNVNATDVTGGLSDGGTQSSSHNTSFGSSKSPNDQLPSFTTTSAQISARFSQMAPHFPMIPGNVVAADGRLIPVTIMYDSGSGISLATSELYGKANYKSQMDYELILRGATNIEHTESKAKLFNLQFIPFGKSKPISINNVTATQSLKLPEQRQDAKAIKERFPHLSNVPLPSYEQQAPQILLGLSHAKLMSHLSSVIGNDGEPVAAMTPLGWVLYGNCLDSCNRTESIVPEFTCETETSDEVSNEDLLKYIRSCNDVESIGIAHTDASILSHEDQQAEKMIQLIIVTVSFYSWLSSFGTSGGTMKNIIVNGSNYFVFHSSEFNSLISNSLNSHFT